jgi:hypothetical protein
MKQTGVLTRLRNLVLNFVGSKIIYLKINYFLHERSVK